MIFYMIVQLMNTYIVGHTNDPVLIAGVGMGNMLINVFAFAVMQGLNGALESLVSVSFGASEAAAKEIKDSKLDSEKAKLETARKDYRK